MDATTRELLDRALTLPSLRDGEARGGGRGRWSEGRLARPAASRHRGVLAAAPSAGRADPVVGVVEVVTGATAKQAPVHYPETDDMGEHELQRYIAELLRPLLERWLGEQRRVAHAGADQFFYWVQGDPGRRRAPDVYVIDGVAQDIPEVASWKTWEGHCPTFALEIVGDDWKKDYEEAPADYGAGDARAGGVRSVGDGAEEAARGGAARAGARRGDRVETGRWAAGARGPRRHTRG